MSTRDSEAQMRSIVSAFSTGDVSGVEELIASDYIDHQGLKGEAIRGPRGFAEVVEYARRGFGSDLEVEVADLIANDDRVAVRLLWRVKRDGSFAVARETIDIVRFRNGRAVEHWGAPVERRHGSDVARR
jgi:predicted ester cyclase